jgi:hypothetical protein
MQEDHMGYDRDDRRYGRDQSYGYRPQGQGRDYERGYARGEDLSYNRDRGYGPGQSRRPVDYGRGPQGQDFDERGFLDRAGDEVRSWFGDEEAERRRRHDERHGHHDHGRDYGRETSGRSFGRDDGAPSSAGYGWEFRDRADPGQRNDRSRDHDHDPHYRSWRDRQMEALDRDYEDYRRENQSRFESEFTGWRGKRQSQRDSLGRVQEHQEVVGSDGAHVGKVDHVRGDRILLAKNDVDAGGHHHSIPSSWIVNVGEKVEIDRTAEAAHRAWKDEESNSAIGGGSPSGNHDREESPRTLNQSFRGTY